MFLEQFHKLKDLSFVSCIIIIIIIIFAMIILLLVRQRRRRRRVLCFPLLQFLDLLLILGQDSLKLPNLAVELLVLDRRLPMLVALIKQGALQIRRDAVALALEALQDLQHLGLLRPLAAKALLVVLHHVRLRRGRHRRRRQDVLHRAEEHLRLAPLQVRELLDAPARFGQRVHPLAHDLVDDALEVGDARGGARRVGRAAGGHAGRPRHGGGQKMKRVVAATVILVIVILVIAMIWCLMEQGRRR